MTRWHTVFSVAVQNRTLVYFIKSWWVILMWKTFSWCNCRSSRATTATATAYAVPSSWWSRTSTTICMPDFSYCRSTITLFPLSVANKRWSKGWRRRCRINTRKTLRGKRVLNCYQWTWRYIPRLWPEKYECSGIVSLAL